MRHRTFAIVLGSLIFLLFGLLEQNSASNLEEYTVVDVVDGDTIKVQQSNKEVTTVRLIGIDTPETSHPSKPVQCFGKEATEKLTAMVLNKTVTLEKDSSEVDRYGRQLRYVYFDGAFVNEKMVREGYALESAFEPDTKYKDLFKAAEDYAMENKEGLWSEDTCNGEL